MSDDESSLIEQPADSSFDFPSLHVTAETSPVLMRWFLEVDAVWRNLFNPPADGAHHETNRRLLLCRKEVAVGGVPPPGYP
jgi:hypothetical protein